MMSILRDILAKFRNKFPDITVNIHTGDAAIALAKLQDDSVDLTVAALPNKLPKNIESIQLLETPLICIGSKNYPETIHYKDGMIDYQKTPLIQAERGISRKRLDRWFRERNITPNIYAQVAGNEAIIAMVNMGCGIGVVPELVLQQSPLESQVVIIENGPELSNFSVGICTKTKNLKRRIVQQFWETVNNS